MQIWSSKMIKIGSSQVIPFEKNCIGIESRPHSTIKENKNSITKYIPTWIELRTDLLQYSAKSKNIKGEKATKIKPDRKSWLVFSKDYKQGWIGEKAIKSRNDIEEREREIARCNAGRTCACSGQRHRCGMPSAAEWEYWTNNQPSGSRCRNRRPQPQFASTSGDPLLLHHPSCLVSCSSFKLKQELQSANI